ncbi:T9SS type A sorting domain-containing protein [bacterium]|nr:T9SS type A sorting domain-containing protein [bacterium]
MKVLLVLSSIALIAGAAFCGTVFGTLEMTTPSTDTAFVIVFHDFVSLYDSMLFYSEAYPPDYDWTITDAGIVDAYNYNAMAIVPSRIPPNPGDPAGQYPSNPFQLSGGSIAGIDIALDTIGNIWGSITEYEGDVDSLMIGLYNYYPYLLGLPPTLTSTHRIGALDYLIEDVPAGAYSVRVWMDLNGNSYFDSTGAYNEPFAWLDNEMGGIAPVGGGCINAANISLPWTGVKELTTLPNRLAVYCHPNPFNSVATVVIVGAGNGLSIEVYDIAGRHISTIAENFVSSGITALRWYPSEELNSGNYFIRVSGNGLTAEKQITLIK